MHTLGSVLKKIILRPRSLKNYFNVSSKSGVSHLHFFLLSVAGTFSPSYCGCCLFLIRLKPIHLLLSRSLRASSLSVIQGALSLKSRSKKLIEPSLQQFLNSKHDLLDADIPWIYTLAIYAYTNRLPVGETLLELVSTKFNPGKQTALIIEEVLKNIPTQSLPTQSEQIKKFNAIGNGKISISDIIDPYSNPGALSKVEHSLKRLIPERTDYFSLPTIFGETRALPSFELKIPAFEVYRFSKAKVLPANVVITKENAVFNYDKGAALLHASVAGTRHHCQAIGNGLALLCFPHLKIKTLSSGVLISGRATSNYFHWLIEYLPKILAIDMLPPWAKNTPIIIDEAMPPTHLESLRQILKKKGWNNALIERAPNECLEVEDLIVPTNPIYHPDRFDLPFTTGSGLSLEHLHFVRNTLLEGFRSNPSPRRLLVCRTNHSTRTISNWEDIQELLIKKYNFYPFYPEKLTFEEQIELFNGATTIIGATGAALSNLLFIKPGTRCIAFIARGNREYSIQSNLATKVGGIFSFIAGENDYPSETFRHKENFVHSSFQISISDIQQALKQYEINEEQHSQ
jgi:hypothetical protein